MDACTNPIKSPGSNRFNPVAMAKRSHPYPSRTRKLSSLASMVLHGRLCGRVERCRVILWKALTVIRLSGLFAFKSSQRLYPCNGTIYVMRYRKSAHLLLLILQVWTVVAMAKRSHPYPSRKRKNWFYVWSLASMVLHARLAIWESGTLPGYSLKSPVSKALWIDNFCCFWSKLKP